MRPAPKKGDVITAEFLEELADARDKIAKLAKGVGMAGLTTSNVSGTTGVPATQIAVVQMLRDAYLPDDVHFADPVYDPEGEENATEVEYDLADGDFVDLENRKMTVVAIPGLEPKSGDNVWVRYSERSQVWVPILIAGGSASGALTSLNGDTTAAQVIESTDGSVTISDLGGGVHNLKVNDGAVCPTPASVGGTIIGTWDFAHSLGGLNPDLPLGLPCGGAAKIQVWGLGGATANDEQNSKMVGTSGGGTGYGEKSVVLTAGDGLFGYSDLQAGVFGVATTLVADTAATFTIPAVSSTVSITVTNTGLMIVGNVYDIDDGAGHAIHAQVTAIADSTHCTIETMSIETGAAGQTMATDSPMTCVDPSSNGTTTTADFTIPAVSSTVSVTVSSTAGMHLGETWCVRFGWFFGDGTDERMLLGTITAIADATHFTFKLVEVTRGSSSGTVKSGSYFFSSNGVLCRAECGLNGRAATSPATAPVGLGGLAANGVGDLVRSGGDGGGTSSTVGGGGGSGGPGADGLIGGDGVGAPPTIAGGAGYATGGVSVNGYVPLSYPPGSYKGFPGNPPGAGAGGFDLRLTLAAQDSAAGGNAQIVFSWGVGVTSINGQTGPIALTDVNGVSLPSPSPGAFSLPIIATDGGGLGEDASGWPAGTAPAADGDGDFNQWTPSGSGPPSPSNGAANSVYIDVSDPSNPQFYYRT